MNFIQELKALFEKHNKMILFAGEMDGYFINKYDNIEFDCAYGKFAFSEGDEK